MRYLDFVCASALRITVGNFPIKIYTNFLKIHYLNYAKASIT